jgi:hypothetical protein
MSAKDDYWTITDKACSFCGKNDNNIHVASESGSGYTPNTVYFESDICSSCLGSILYEFKAIKAITAKKDFNPCSIERK